MENLLFSDGNVQIFGNCEGNYKPVQDAFIQNFVSGQELNASICVYVKQKCVIDMYGTSMNDKSYNANCLQPVFSCGKNVASLVIATLVDKGYLRYDAKVTEYWPEFGKHNKEDIKLEDILRHEGGLTTFMHSFQWKEFGTDSIKKNVIGNVIENCNATFPSNHFNPDGTVSKRAYHGATRGFILNEIVRRVDPNGRTIGEICREDLKLENLYCGLRNEELSRVTMLDAWSMGWVATQSMLPYFLGSTVHVNIFDLYKLTTLRQARIEKIGPQKPVYVDAPKAPYMIYKIVEEEDIRKGEIPSGNFHGNARSLGKLASVMADKGKNVDGKGRLLSEEVWVQMHSEAKWAMDAQTGYRTCFTQGGINKFEDPEEPNEFEAPLMGYRNGYFGWYGMGGSVMQWDPDLKIGFGYTPTLFQWYDLQNTKGAKLQKLVSDCAKNSSVEELN